MIGLVDYVAGNLFSVSSPGSFPLPRISTASIGSSSPESAISAPPASGFAFPAFSTP
jgi:hypothetical protein